MLFIGQVPKTQNNKLQRNIADIIIVLTGGSGRIEYGLQLLAERKADILFISGVGEKVTIDDIIKQAPIAIRGKLNKEKIILGRNAENTIGNAKEVASWLSDKATHHVLLVTSNYHIPRSVLEFSTEMPQLVIIPAPVLPKDFKPDNWWKDDEDRALIFSEYHKYIAGELRHLFLMVF